MIFIGPGPISVREKMVHRVVPEAKTRPRLAVLVLCVHLNIRVVQRQDQLDDLQIASTICPEARSTRQGEIARRDQIFLSPLCMDNVHSSAGIPKQHQAGHLPHNTEPHATPNFDKRTCEADTEERHPTLRIPKSISCASKSQWPRGTKDIALMSMCAVCDIGCHRSI